MITPSDKSNNIGEYYCYSKGLLRKVAHRCVCEIILYGIALMNQKTIGSSERKSKMRFSTLLMDADDTLFDFTACEYNALEKTMEAFGLEFNERIHKCFSEINSGLWRQFEKNRITRSELRVRRFSRLLEECFSSSMPADDLADAYVEQLSMQAVLFDESEEAVKELSKYYAIYIITNGLKTVQYGRFSRIPLKQYLKGLFISDEMGVQKPSAEYFRLVMEKIDEKDADRILVVGDSLTSDMQGGRNAGLHTCLFDPYDMVTMPNELCDYKIHSLKEILKL